MAISKATRKKMEDVIYRTFDALDPSGENTNVYRNKFSKMTDAQFDTFFKRFFNDEDQYLILQVVDYERELSIEKIEKAANVLKIPLYEKVVQPFVNEDKENPIVTKEPTVVGYLHIKRMQQVLSKKNAMSTDISKRSAITGQVTNSDKNARDSDVENFALVTMDAENALRELLGPRADDPVMKAEMYSDISKDGYVSLNKLTNHVDNKTTLNTVDAFLICMGIKTDLVTKDLALTKTLDKDI